MIEQTYRRDDLGEPTPVQVYNTQVYRRGGWWIIAATPGRYAAAVAYNDAEPPARMLAIGRTGGTILHQKPEPGTIV